MRISRIKVNTDTGSLFFCLVDYCCFACNRIDFCDLPGTVTCVHVLVCFVITHIVSGYRRCRINTFFIESQCSVSGNPSVCRIHNSIFKRSCSHRSIQNPGVFISTDSLKTAIGNIRKLIEDFHVVLLFVYPDKTSARITWSACNMIVGSNKNIVMLVNVHLERRNLSLLKRTCSQVFGSVTCYR